MSSQEGTPAVKKSWLVMGGVAIALAGVGFFAMQGPMSGKDLSGSIVPAERYQTDAKPITDGSAVLGDETISRFMQTDVYQLMLKDPSIVDAMNSQAFRDAMNNQAFRDAMNSQAFRDAMGNQAFRDAMGNQAFRDAMGNQAFRDAMGNQAFRDAMNSQAFRDAMKNDANRLGQASQ
jgi:hypothetical protein